MFGSKGSGPGQFKNPAGVAVSNDYMIYVADHNNHRIQVSTNTRTHARTHARVLYQCTANRFLQVRQMNSGIVSLRRIFDFFGMMKRVAN